jgi:subtilisin family serine protease
MRAYSFLAIFLTLLVSANAAEIPALVNNPAFTNAHPNPARPVVAVLDTGVDYNHTDLEPAIARAVNQTPNEILGWDFQENDPLPYDYAPPLQPIKVPDCAKEELPSAIGLDLGCLGLRLFYGSWYVYRLITQETPGHGTHVAGIIRHYAPQAAIAPYRIRFRGSSSIQSVIEAIEMADAAGVRVVNMSFSFSSNVLPEDQKDLDRLRQMMARTDHILFVVAAGNESQVLSPESTNFPAVFPLENILTVGATDYAGQLAPFSNVGEGVVDVYAPGVRVSSTWPGGGTAVLSGTSMAAPFVTALAARIALGQSEKLERYTGAELRKRVMSLTRPRRFRFAGHGAHQPFLFTARALGRFRASFL